MTWLWDKLRNSIRNGRLRIKLRQLPSENIPTTSFQTQSNNNNSNGLLRCNDADNVNDDHQYHDDDADIVIKPNCKEENIITNELESEEEEESSSILSICLACKLAVERYNDYQLSSQVLLSTTVATSTLSFDRRRKTCPFCGIRYCDSSAQERAEAVVEPTIGSNRRRSHCGGGISYSTGSSRNDERNRQERSFSEPENRLPPIQTNYQLDSQIQQTDDITAGNLFRRLENLNLLLSSQSRIVELLPPIFTDSSAKRPECLKKLVEFNNGSAGLVSKKPFVTKRENFDVEGKLRTWTSVYPGRYKNRQEFLQDVRKAQQSDNYSSLHKFFTKTFSSFEELCALLKVDPEKSKAKVYDPELKMDFVYSIYDVLEDMPNMIHKAILKSIINSLLDSSRTQCDKDELRSIFILLLCPTFMNQSSYVVFAHLMRFAINMERDNHQYLANWFKILEVNRLKSIVRKLTQFITIRQFSPGDKSLPPGSKTKWWIPTAIKLLALINVANNESTPPLLHYTELYNSSLDHIDLMQDYYVWQNCKHPGQFAFCQYPFVLSILAKRIILTKDSEQQMILNARRSLVAKMGRHQAPQIDIFFLNINVRRCNIVSDSLNEITCKQKDLKKKLKVSFVGEPGLDMGGLTKEWFLLVIREIFHSDYGMFVYHHHSRCYWFSLDNKEGSLREYNLIGVLMGLAVYNSNILDLHFPSVCYRKLLTPVVVPNANENTVGIISTLSIDDLAEIMPDIARSLTDLLNHEGNVEEDFYLNYQISIEEYGEIKTYDLIEKAEQIAVTNENRLDYVNRYLDLILNTAVYDQFKAFYLGFHSVCASNALIMLRGEEVEMLVCGLESLNVQELQKITEYDGFEQDEDFIIEFWDIVKSFSEDLKKKFLLFTTGSDRIPVGGVSEMTFKITRLPLKLENLPEAHTCFNQLVIPRYECKATLREKLITAISNAEGFGLE